MNASNWSFKKFSVKTFILRMECRFQIEVFSQLLKTLAVYTNF